MGYKVRFLGCSEAQRRWGSNDDPSNKLYIGSIYTISMVETHPWHTKISVTGIDGKFNSACFEIVTVPKMDKMGNEELVDESVCTCGLVNNDKFGIEHSKELLSRLNRGQKAIELNKLYKEYIEFINTANEGAILLAHVHGWRCPQDVIDEGERRRKEIAEYEGE